ncbi:hypothetical protein Sste5346_005447 [Sporothrix stenoceras]|uniref:Uncharacterized protein n=1 Tax=Sporothrix stenoceras TaxID=5173 RepID=A0ABR3Z484_9PEZI
MSQWLEDQGCRWNLLGVAGANYELAAAIPAVSKYLLAESGWSRDTVSVHKERLQAILINYLLSKGDAVQIWGEPVADRTKRVPVISFTVKGRSSKDIVDQIQTQSTFGCKWGSFFVDPAVRGLSRPRPGRRRRACQSAHYNTEEEITKYT